MRGLIRSGLYRYKKGIFDTKGFLGICGDLMRSGL